MAPKIPFYKKLQIPIKIKHKEDTDIISYLYLHLQFHTSPKS
jgi:hypothetical protein